MKVLVLHSAYRVSGGEDASLAAETALLQARGHDVRTYVVSSAAQEDLPRRRQVETLVFGSELRRELSSVASRLRPDVIYVNNWFPWLGWPVLQDFHRAGTPMLVAVRNYRLWCMTGLRRRDGAECNDCMRIPMALPGVGHGCYGGRAPSLAAASVVTRARRGLLGASRVRFAAVSRFVADFLVANGVDESRVHIKPNVVFPAPSPGPGGDGIVLAARLEPEKGIREAIAAIKRLPHARLTVAGTGSLMDEVAKDPSPQINYIGAVSTTELWRIIGGSRATIVPSTWDEPFGRVAAESLACGTPVIAGSNGGLPEVLDEESGLVVDVGKNRDLVESLDRVISESRWRGGARISARQRFDDHFSGAAVGPRLERALAETANLR